MQNANRFTVRTWNVFRPSACKVACFNIFIPVAKSRLTDVSLADTMIGKAVEHMFETEEGPKEEWRGMVLARAPIMTTWFYITYEKDPVLYMYQLLDDYKEGDLRIMPDSSKSTSAAWRSAVDVFEHWDQVYIILKIRTC